MEQLLTIEERISRWKTYPQGIAVHNSESIPLAPSTGEAEVREYFAGLTESEKDLLRKTNIIVAGCGNAGGNMIFEMLMNGIGTEGRIFLFDPDVVEEKNINSGQPYTETAIGDTKVAGLKSTLTLAAARYARPVFGEISKARSVQPTPPQIRTFDRGMYEGELTDIFIHYDLDPANTLIIDGIDIAAPDAVLQLHKEARGLKAKVVSGLDLAYGATSIGLDYEYIGKNSGHLLNEYHIDLYTQLTEILDTSNPAGAEQLKLASYRLLLDGLIETADFTPSLVKMFLEDSQAQSGSTTQYPKTARFLGAKTAQMGANLLLNKFDPNELTQPIKVRYDLDTESRSLIGLQLHRIKQLFSQVAGAAISKYVRHQFEQLVIANNLHIETINQ